MNRILYNKINKADFQKIFKKKNYAFFTNGAYNLNIIGVRAANRKVTNTFDDYIVVIYKTKTGTWNKRLFEATTDPGLSYIKSPINEKIGTAILVPGQYRSAYKVGKHKNKYKALVQNKPVKVYRDRNKDNIYDCNPNSIEEGIFGINIHKAGTSSKLVDKWSAGCQVISSNLEFNCFMSLVDKQLANIKGDTFTYTLLNEEDLNEG